MALTQLHSDAPSQTNDSSTPENTDERTDRLWTIPNVLSGARLIGSFGLVGLALVERPMLVLALFVALEMTDWFDGRLAIALNQRTSFGARLDSAADATLATATLFAGLWLHWTMLQPELALIVTAIGTYAVSSLFGLVKFGKVPAYHTFGAKKCWGLITIGVICVFAELTVWPLRIALIGVTITNLEAILITFFLREFRVDIRSLYRVLQDRKNAASEQ